MEDSNRFLKTVGFSLCLLVVGMPASSATSEDMFISASPVQNRPFEDPGWIGWAGLLGLLGILGRLYEPRGRNGVVKGKRK